ncbi:hypothetical protein I580_03022 [Enterococcus caccae ATCC BAA-1240]|uniref:Bacterial repeat domain-containing protein n=1 Tax=Enterococcus caccae ATCC BAA-1240 TaxID=1158612 RepID=R3WR55_9ENTE|nr:hypothetical protein UC7_00547 [Enterococcus caccae ATCC BAA-1240]EOT56222.1 hypothetical protein I580_03022 [Enterococcus caccae ATCC BAA-1240]
MNNQKNSPKTKLRWILIVGTIISIFSVMVLYGTTKPIVASSESDLKEGIEKQVAVTKVETENLKDTSVLGEKMREKRSVELDNLSNEQNNKIKNPNLRFTDKDTEIPNWRIQGGDTPLSIFPYELILEKRKAGENSRMLKRVETPSGDDPLGHMHTSLNADEDHLVGATESAKGTIIFSQQIETVANESYEFSADYLGGITSIRADNQTSTSGPNTLLSISLTGDSSFKSTGVYRFTARSKITTLSFRAQAIKGPFQLKNMYIAPRSNLLTNPNLQFGDSNTQIPSWNIMGTTATMSETIHKLSLGSKNGDSRNIKWPKEEVIKTKVSAVKLPSNDYLRSLWNTSAGTNTSGTIILGQTIDTEPSSTYELTAVISGGMTNARVYGGTAVSGPGNIVDVPLTSNDTYAVPITPIRFEAPADQTTISFRSKNKLGSFSLSDVIIVRIDKGAPITVNYVDDTGVKIAPSDRITGGIGDPYIIIAKDIANYVPYEDQEIHGYFSNEEENFTMIYKKYGDNWKHLTAEPSPVEGGSVSVEADRILTGQATTITAIPNAEYKFINWEILSGEGASISDDQSASTTFTMGTTDAKIRAVFEKRNQKVNVEFLDETGEALHDKITFDKEIGTTIDLTKEIEVKQAIASILAKNYQIKTKPENETKIPVTNEESTMLYQFNGILFVQSSPTFLNFGRKTLGIPSITVEKAKYDKPLIVWDNRKNSGPWNLTATLKKPLTSQEDPSKVLPSAIRYKIDAIETVILSENTTQEIAKRTHETKGQYNVSSEWDKNESGLLLEVPSRDVLQAGNYRATILWQVEQVP